MCVLIEKNITHMHCNTSKYCIEIVDHVKIFKVYDELQYVNCNSTHTKIFVTVLKKKPEMYQYVDMNIFWIFLDVYFYESANNCWIFKLSLHFCMRAEYYASFKVYGMVCLIFLTIHVRCLTIFLQDLINLCTCICICVYFIFDDNCWNCW